MVSRIIGNLKNVYNSEMISTTVILTVLCMVLFLAIYEFVVYRLISKKTFYSKSFNISIAVLPFFISTIILSLQSNLVITLGTIGALAIIRFRTAIKDPVDMIYILWSVHIGITCGCQLYELAVLTSLAVTVLLIVLDKFTIGKAPYILVIHSNDCKEEVLLSIIEECAKKIRVKSRNYTNEGTDYVIEVSIKETGEITERLTKQEGIERFSLLAYDSEDIL